MCKIFVFRNKVSKKHVQMLPRSLVHSWANVFNLMAQIFHLEVPSGEFTLICAIVISKFSVLKSGIQVFQICMKFQIFFFNLIFSFFLFFFACPWLCTGRRILHFHVHDQWRPLWFFFFFFCLSAQQSVMAMMILPLLPHFYENFCWQIFEVGKKCVGVPPLSNFFRAGAKFLASRSSSETFCPP